MSDGFAQFDTQARRRGDRLVAKEHICRQCRFAGIGAAFLVSELLIEVDEVDGSAGTYLPLHPQEQLFLLFLLRKRKLQLQLQLWLPSCFYCFVLRL